MEKAAEEDYGIKILKNGDWLHMGRAITRHNLVKLFASVLKKDEKGDYWLITPAERGRIEVEDVPFIAVEMMTEGAGQAQNIHFRTNLDVIIPLDAAHPLRVVHHPVTGEPAPYILVKDNLEARLTRATYYALADLAVQKDNMMGVWSHGSFHALGNIGEQGAKPFG